MIKHRTYKFYNNLSSTKKTTEGVPNKYVSLPYTNELSEKLKYILKKHNIEACHKTHNKLSSLFTNLKTRTPTMKQSNVIYSVPCGNCSKKYIGMTTQLLKNRLNGHKYTKNTSTALNKHVIETKHEFNYNETKILNKDHNYYKLSIKEMIEIKKDINAVNDRTDIGGLSRIYANLIQ